jgi:hypothetical protein
VPKQATVDHHEAGVKGVDVFHLLCFLFLWCFVACRWWVLFFFFMVVTELSVGQTRILCCLELVVDGVRVLYYMKKFSTDEKLSSWIWVRAFPFFALVFFCDFPSWLMVLLCFHCTIKWQNGGLWGRNALNSMKFLE